MSRKYKNIRYKDTGGSNIDLSGIVEHMIPTIDSDGIIGQDLGAPNKKWRDLYLSKGSLYIDGQKVIESNNGTITVQADANQSLLTQTSGTGSLQLSSDNGIQLMGEVNAGTGDLNIGTNIDMNTSLVRELGSPLLGTDAANKNYVDSQVVAALDAGNNISAADLTVSGNLTVSGTTTTVNSETISLADNIIDLNSNFTSGSPTENAGLKVKRGDDADVQIRWNEASDQWEYTNDGAAYSAIGSGSVDLSGYDTSAEVDAKVAAVDLSGYDTSAEVDAKVANASSGSSSSSDHDFVASGTLPNGAPVVLNTDGTISFAGGGSTTIPASQGNETVFCGNSTSYSIEIAFVPNNANTFIVSYTNPSSVNLCVGTIAGNIITFASSVEISGVKSDEHPRIAFDPNGAGDFVLIYTRDSGYGSPDRGTAIAGTVSGTTITVGSEYTFCASDTVMPIIGFDPSTPGKFVVCYKDDTNSDYGTARVGTVSGTSISFGSAVIYNYGHTLPMTNITFSPNNDGTFLTHWVDYGNSYRPTVIAGVVSGTSISFGSEVAFDSTHNGANIYSQLFFDPTDSSKFIICYSDGDSENSAGRGGQVVIGTLSGTTINIVSAPVPWADGWFDYVSASFSPDIEGKFIITYRDKTNNDYGTMVVGTLSGTAITFTAPVVFRSANTPYTAVTFDPNGGGKYVAGYMGDNGEGTVFLGQIPYLQTSNTNLTADNFIGVSTSAYVDGETATITLDGGISTNQVGLTPGEIYHVLDDGSLSTTSTATSSEVGKALSSTDLQIDTKRAVDLSGYDTSAEVDAKVAAVDLSGYDTSAEVDAKVAALVDSAPGALDTLNELAAALGDDANYAASVATTMATKATTSYVDTAVAAHAPTWSEITTSTTVTANSRNLVDTSVGSITITLPANPTLGDEVTFIDASGYAATNNITVDSNGEKIQGETGDLLINVNRAAFQVVYHNVANGWVLMEV